MSEHDKSGQARKGLIDSVKGKAKEVVGAITRNDSLTAEGQLEQTQARDRMDANSVEAVADAEAEQARVEAAEARKEGAQERAAVNDKTRAAEYNVRNDQAAQKRSAELAAERDSEQAKMRAELDAQLKVQQAKDAEREEIDAATEEAVDAAAEHQSSVRAGRKRERRGRSHQTAGRHDDQPSRPALSTGEKQENLMKIAEIPFAALRFQYQIARIPLQLIEDQMAARLYKEAPMRLFYERSLGSLDAAVGNLLGDPKLSQRGTALVERSDALSRAAKLDAKADAKREQADAKLDASARRGGL